MKHQKLIIAAVVFIILCSAVIYYLPVMKKGYVPQLSSGDLILARNLALTGVYALENEKGIILSSENFNQNSLPADAGSRLTSYLYASLFKVLKPNTELPIYVAIACFALANLILFFLVKRLLGLWQALFFSLLYLFIPAVWDGALFPGFYEFGVLFFSLGLCVYLYRDKCAWWQLALAGVFFGLAAAARNAFAISFVAVFIFDFIDKRSLKRLFILGFPCLLIFLVFIGRNNIYTQQGGSESFGQYAHAFPDPYTFIFERDQYAQKMLAEAKGDVGQYFSDYGYKIGVKQQVLAFINSIKFYSRELINLINYGGPLIIFFAIVGWFELKKKKPELIKFFSIWFGLLFVILIGLRTSNWDHLLEILFPVVLLAAAGFLWLFEIIRNSTLNKNNKVVLMAVLLFAIIGHFIIADKWMFHEEYTTGNMELLTKQAQIIKSANLSGQEVIAYGGHPAAVHHLNWLTDKNIVKFAPETLVSLSAGNKLKESFTYFGVTHILGYESNLADQVVSLTQVKGLDH